MLINTYLYFDFLENISSQLLYRALSQVSSMVRKHFVFHFHVLGYIQYEMDVSETFTTG